MAIKLMTLTCDGSFCNYEADDYRTEAEAMEEGWFILRGPERELGGTGEKCFCSRDCLEGSL